MKPEFHVASDAFRNASDAFRKRNPHLFIHDIKALAAIGDKSAAFKKLSSQPAGKPIRQRTKKPSQAELEFIAWLKAQHTHGIVLHEQLAFRLANGVVYWPDVVVINPMYTAFDAYEVKGRRRKDAAWARDDSRVKLKVAAGQYPWIQWTLVWKDESGNWQEQVITS
jgi:hypothetical protein